MFANHSVCDLMGWQPNGRIALTFALAGQELRQLGDVHGDDPRRPSPWRAVRVPVEKRAGVFLERVVARLQLHRGFTDADLDDAVRAALTGLIQSAA